MLNRLIALAIQSVRAAIRSRVLLSLLAALVLFSFGIPLTIRGDGTLAGQVRIMIQYTLALGMMVVGVGALWSAAASISAEVESGDIRLVMVKPVRPFEIWLGKWIGLTAMNGLLLLSSTAVMAGLIAFKLGAEASAENRAAVTCGVLSARRILAPRTESVSEAEIRTEFAALAREGQLAADATLGEYRDRILRKLLARRNAVEGGAKRSWVFDVPASSTRNSGVQARFMVSCGSPTVSDMSGEWQAGPPDHPDAFVIAGGRYGEGLHNLDIPASAMPRGGTLVLTFRNDAGAPTAVFPVGRPVQILAGEGTFAWNLLRAVLAAWACMATVTALGLTAGTVFSFPVAAFVSCSAILMLLISHYYVSTPDMLQPGGTPLLDFVQHAGAAIAGAIHFAGSPAIDAMPAGRLADGILISPAETALSVLILAGAYPAILGAVGGWLLGRREIAVPDVS